MDGVFLPVSEDVNLCFVSLFPMVGRGDIQAFRITLSDGKVIAAVHAVQTKGGVAG